MTIELPTIEDLVIGAVLVAVVLMLGFVCFLALDMLFGYTVGEIQATVAHVEYHSGWMELRDNGNNNQIPIYHEPYWYVTYTFQYTGSYHQLGTSLPYKPNIGDRYNLLIGRGYLTNHLYIKEVPNNPVTSKP